MELRLLPLVVFLVAARAAAGPGGPQASQPDAIELFVAALERVAATGDRQQIFSLVHPDAEMAGISEFYSSVTPAPERLVIKERDRTPLEEGGLRLLLEVFSERGIEGRLLTWRADVLVVDADAGKGTAPAWRLARMERLTVVSGLYSLELDTTRQFDVRNLTLTAPDLTIEMASGNAFVAEASDGPTAVVLVGRGRMLVAPSDQAEQTQLRIFGGSNALDADFDAAFIRVRPSEFRTRFGAESLVPRQVSSRDAGRARDIFDEFIGRTLHLDLGDLSRDRWSLVPSVGDLIAEVRTRRYGSLTYTRVWNEAEDISVFDRARRRNITVYASSEKLAARGRFYSEDDLVDYDVLSYDLDVAYSPDRLWFSGVARVKIRVRASSLTTMTMRLAEALTVRGVHSPDFGRLLHLRVVGQNSLIVSLPATLVHGTELWLSIIYSGRLEPQGLDREAISLGQEPDPLQIPLEPRYMYSNRSYWYPQATVSDYATARIRLVVPPAYDVVATGMPTGDAAPAAGPVSPGERPWKAFVFDAERPVRYLAFVASRFSTVHTSELAVPSLRTGTLNLAETIARAGGDADAPRAEANSSLSLIVQANPRQTGRARAVAGTAAEILRFYASLMGEAPYPSFTLAVAESDLPGGHSPPYFALLNETRPTAAIVWRNDPVAFENYPTFFLAHELAHQWWGQAVGWKNYHEQWISEGFAQYFATLFAEEERGSDTLQGVLRQMRRWALEESDQGPVYLGYRLGHIESESRVFRALVYNKAAMVLHMLRRLVGDESFFAGLRRFYADWRFKKAGADDFRLAMEAATGRDLTRFFEGWIYGSAVPRLKFTHAVKDDNTVLLRLEHLDAVVDLPVSVTLTYTDGQKEVVVIGVTERVVERSIPLKSRLRRVEVNDDHAALAEFER
ncbi:MAG TPA: M1 family aminopeptidase [Vicinamibacterales bacterium]|nr:M1 family aminopeptidase [Vicinamibacterales bacterium]